MKAALPTFRKSQVICPVRSFKAKHLIVTTVKISEPLAIWRYTNATPSQTGRPHHDNSNELRTYHVEVEYNDLHVAYEYGWCNFNPHEKNKQAMHAISIDQLCFLVLVSIQLHAAVLKKPNSPSADKSPPPVPVLNRTNPYQTLSSYFRKAHFNTVNLTS
jgi:hypothetical protein